MIKFGEIKIGATARKHINDCLDSNWVTMGNKVKLFEEQWAKKCNAEYCVAVNSGTSAVLAMCASLYDFGAKPGDEIIVPALSFCATWNAVIAAGFKPVPVDVDLNTLNIIPEKIEENISSKTVAILPVALMGKPYDTHAVEDIATSNGLWHLADGCESHLCLKDRLPIESVADACAYSFFSAHLLFAVEFGGVTTQNSQIKDIIKSVRSHGRKPDDLYFEFERFGLNLKPTDIHASIGLEGLENAKQSMDKRRSILYKFNSFLQKHKDKVYLVEEEPQDINCPHALSITMKYSVPVDELKRRLDGKVEYKRNFGAITQHKAFQRLGYTEGSFHNAEYIGDHGIHLPCHAYMSDADVFQIINILEDYFNEK